MPIIPDTPNLDDSPWYKKVEEKAEAWNQFAIEIGGEIEGYYNAWGLGFDLIVTVNDCYTECYGERSLDAPFMSYYLPIKDKIFEELVIWMDIKNNSKENSFRIRRKSLKNYVTSWFSKFKKKKIDGPFIIEYNSEYIINSLSKFNFLSFNNLRQIERDEVGFILQMFYLPKERESQRTIFEFCKYATEL